MTRPHTPLLALSLVSVTVWACSSSSGHSGVPQGSSAGQAGSARAGGGGGAGAEAGGGAGAGSGGDGGGGRAGMGSGGTAGSGGGAGMGSGGTAGLGGGAGMGSGGTAGSGGAAGASAGRGGSSGSGGSSGGGGSSGSGGSSESPTACSVDDDCVVAEVDSSSGCCSRHCGTALNGEYVASDPCSTTDPMTDPVPAECSTGCTQCPAADPRCELNYGAVCISGTCTLVTVSTPCETTDECVLAIDYETVLGACCQCPLSASKAALAHANCIVAVGEPKPSGCDLDPVDACASVSCPITCAEPSTSCSASHRCGA